MMAALIRCCLLMLAVGIGPALAQGTETPTRAASTVDNVPPGTLNPKPLPPLPDPNAPNVPAKDLFARKLTPFPGPPRAIGSYADGCMEGAEQLPISGPDWQVMRLSRDRNWGNPELIKFIERLGANAKKVGWNGLLIGDMAQPRGGPMISGHASHQIGLDVDIWFTPMPHHVMSREEREMDGAVNMVEPSGLAIDPKLWTPTRTALLKAAAEDPKTVRIFVNAAIKKEVCREVGTDRAWLAKLRPWWGHAEHFHVRLVCPPGNPQCKDQPPVPAGDGCGHALDWWFRPGILHPAPPKGPAKPPHFMTLAGLPPACRAVVKAP